MIKGKRREDSESEWKTFVTHSSVDREREEKGEQRGRRVTSYQGGFFSSRKLSF